MEHSPVPNVYKLTLIDSKVSKQLELEAESEKEFTEWKSILQSQLAAIKSGIIKTGQRERRRTIGVANFDNPLDGIRESSSQRPESVSRTSSLSTDTSSGKVIGIIGASGRLGQSIVRHFLTKNLTSLSHSKMIRD